MVKGKSIINKSKQTLQKSDSSGIGYLRASVNLSVEKMTYFSAYDLLVAYTYNDCLCLLQINGSKIKALKKLHHFSCCSFDSSIASPSTVDICAKCPYTFFVATSDSQVNGCYLRDSFVKLIYKLDKTPNED